MKPLVVIVNYRTVELTVACLASLRGQVPPGGRAVVVDNGSADGSASAIATAIERRGWSSWCSLVAIDSNRGYSAGNNVAIAPALRSPHPPELFLLLNPDTVVHPGALRALVEFMQLHPEAGIAGPRLEDPAGRVQRSAFRFPCCLAEFEQAIRLGPVSRLLSRWIVAPAPPSHACRVGWVSGAALLVRRQVLETIGLLDDGFFLYFEEVDLCLRAARSGWESWYVPAARITHLRGRSAASSLASSQCAAISLQSSRRRYFRKHHGAAYALAADLAAGLGRALGGIRLRLTS